MSKSERKRFNVQQGKPMMEGVTDPITPKPEGNDFLKALYVSKEDMERAYKMGIAQGVAQERARWEKLKTHCLNGMKASSGHEYEDVLEKMTELEG